MTESDWDDFLEQYRIKRPFGGEFKAVEIEEDDVDPELLEECLENHIVSDVSEGYFLSPHSIKEHLEVINERGMEAYLEKRLEVLDEQQ